MSWLDKIQTDFTITTGDGKKYLPSLVITGRAVEYNIAEFQFKGLAGTLVYRGEPRGTRYPVEMYFKGANHLDTAKAFLESAANKKAWQVYHPYYEGLLVQPIGMFLDNSLQNVTRITGEIVETITADGTKPQISAPDKIASDKTNTDAALVNSYYKDIPQPTAGNRVSLLAQVNNIYNSVSGFIRTNTDFSDFTNAYNTANALINTVVFDTLRVMRQVQDLINLPARFADTLQNRLNMFRLQLDILSTAADNITSFPSYSPQRNFHNKKLYEFNAGTAIGGMLLASVTDIGTAYDNRVDVLAVADSIVSYYNAYLVNLDTLQSTTGADTNAFVPNADAMNALSQLVNYAVNALLVIANDSRQERITILEDDSDLIQLAHRFYGLLADDSTIEYFRTTNNIGISELLEIKKGRRLVSYV